MNGPVVAIDVSKGSSHYQGYKELNVRYSNVRNINHNREGLNEILSLIRKMESELHQEVCVAYEATGVYHRVLEKFFNDHNIKQFIINPLLAAKTRKTGSIRTPKTDKLDPKSIAKTYYNHQLFPDAPKEKTYHDLRQLSRYYEDILVHIRKDKVSFRAMLDVVYPGYDKEYKDLYGPVALALIEKYPHPDLIVNKSVKTVTKYLLKQTCHSEIQCERYAIKAIEFAKTVYSGCDKEDIEVDILRRQIRRLKEHLEEADNVIKEMTDIASDLDEYHLIKTIPGIGENLAVRIIGEIGNIKKFKKASQLVAYAGTDPIVNESGQETGEHLPISKKGNKRLRCLLYLAVTCSLRLKVEDNVIKEYYIKKKQQSNPLNSKAAKIACANKLLRIIYSMCKNGTVYQQK